MAKFGSFERIWGRAAERKGGEDSMRSMLRDPDDAETLAGRPDSFFLSTMSKCVFQAGFSWSVVEQKWPGFELAFSGFDPGMLTTLSDEEWEAFARDERIIRNPQKIKAVRGNLWFVLDTAAEHGGFGQFLAEWPGSQLVELLAHLKKQGSRLGGATGQRFLRFSGKDTFVLSGDVVACLRGAGLDVAPNPSSRRDLEAIQEVFNQWHVETGHPYQHLSMVMGWSTGENYIYD